MKLLMNKDRLTPAIKQFLKLFIRPLLKKQEEDGEVVNLQAAIETFFAGNKRVFSARTTRELKLPGQLLSAGNKVTPGIPRPILPKGTKLLIAIDYDLKSCNIELENEEIHRVTFTQFKSLARNLSDIGKAAFRDRPAYPRKLGPRD